MPRQDNRPKGIRNRTRPYSPGTTAPAVQFRGKRQIGSLAAQELNHRKPDSRRPVVSFDARKSPTVGRFSTHAQPESLLVSCFSSRNTSPMSPPPQFEEQRDCNQKGDVPPVGQQGEPTKYEQELSPPEDDQRTTQSLKGRAGIRQTNTRSLASAYVCPLTAESSLTSNLRREEISRLPRADMGARWTRLRPTVRAGGQEVSKAAPFSNTRGLGLRSHRAREDDC